MFRMCPHIETSQVISLQQKQWPIIKLQIICGYKLPQNVRKYKSVILIGGLQMFLLQNRLQYICFIL